MQHNICFSGRAIKTGICTSLFILLCTTAAICAEITFVIKKLNNNRGTVEFTLFTETEAEAFPLKREKSVCKKSVTIRDNSARVTCEVSLGGTYAANIFHDENSNGKLDHSWVGLPKEQFGFSNDVTATFGLPNFEKAAFIVNKDTLTITINAQTYF